VYDLTEWVEAHPGGPSHLIKSAGKDASAVFNIFHPEGTIEKSETLPITALKGSVDPDTLPKVPQGAAPPRPSEDEKKKIPLEAIVGKSLCVLLCRRDEHAHSRPEQLGLGRGPLPPAHPR
jgi:L-lactate dehydrogenase (cytochrome)